MLIEGINTTEGTGGAGFYFDYSSLEEVFLGTSGQSAEMPNPGVQSQFIAKSGGNQFNGEYYLDWYNNSLQGSNMPDDYTDADGVRQHPASASTATRSTSYYDYDDQRRRPDQEGQAVVVRHLPQAEERRRAAELHRSTRRSTRSCGTRSARAPIRSTRTTSSSATTSGARRCSPTACPLRAPTPTPTPDQTYKQNSGSWVYKGEWNGTISDKLYVEARYGDFGYYFPLLTNSDENFFFRDTGTLSVPGAQQQLAARSRPQAVDRRGHLLPRHRRRAATPSSSAARC